MASNAFNDLLVQYVADIAYCLRGEYNLTVENVPRIIFSCTKKDNEFQTVNASDKLKISCVYLASTQQWKAFFPFPAVKQSRKYFTSMPDLVAWLDEMGVNV